MIQPSYAVARNLPGRRSHPPVADVTANLVDASQLACMEDYLRDFLIDDAAGALDWNVSESTLDEVFEIVGARADKCASPKQISDLCSTLMGRIGFDILAPQKPRVLAVLGSGAVADAHIAAAFTHRKFDVLRIYARQPVAANMLAKKFRHHPAKPIEIVATPEEALHKADAIILASGARRPEIDPDWIMPEAHITCAFPQAANAHELPLELVARAKVIASDYPQAIGLMSDHLVSASYAKRRVIHLGAMIDRFNPDRSRGITVLLMSGAQELCAPVLKSLNHARSANTK